MFAIHESHRAGKTYYTFSFCGHAGSIKEAAQRTPGVIYLNGSWGNNRAGGSNRYDLELSEPSQELCRQFLANYRAVCQEKADQRKAKVLPDFVPVARMDGEAVERILEHQDSDFCLPFSKKWEVK